MDTDVLVIGGGAAGLAAATRLRAQAPATRVTLVNPSSFNLYRPWFIYALPGLMPADDLRIPLDRMAEQHGFTFRRSGVDKLDPGSRTALADGEPITYQRVIVAAGAVTNRGAVNGAAAHAVFPCDLAGLAELRQRVQAMRDGTASFVLTGERISPGLEYAAWLARAYHAAGRHRVRVRLIVDGDRLLDQFGPGATHRIRDRLGSWGAELVLGTPVRSIAADHVALSDGRTLPSAVTAVVGPLRGPDLQAATLTDQHGFFTVNPALQSVFEPTVFVAGDAVAHGVGWCKNWPLSVRQAMVAADNAVRDLVGDPLASFDGSRERWLSRLSLPDVGGAAFLVWSQRLLTCGAAARRLRAGFDRKHFARYLPADTRWKRIPG